MVFAAGPASCDPPLATMARRDGSLLGRVAGEQHSLEPERAALDKREAEHAGGVPLPAPGSHDKVADVTADLGEGLGQSVPKHEGAHSARR